MYTDTAFACTKHIHVAYAHLKEKNYTADYLDTEGIMKMNLTTISVNMKVKYTRHINYEIYHLFK